MKRNAFLFFGLMILLPSLSSAHNIWLEPSPIKNNQYYLTFINEEAEQSVYDPNNSIEVKAFDLNKKEIPHQNSQIQKLNFYQFIQQPSVILGSLNFGYWSQQTNGKYVNKPKNEVENSPKGVQALKYHKSIITWNKVSTLEYHQPLEIIPLSNKQPKAGQILALKVLYHGKPLAHAGLLYGVSDDKPEYFSNEQGIVKVKVVKNRNLIYLGHRVPILNNDQATEMSLDYTLLFYAAE